MRQDVLALQQFYEGPLGAAARRAIQRRLQAAWGDLEGRDVLGLGYATPFLEAAPRARRIVAAMPAAQGAERWPHAAPCRTVLFDEDRLPFMDAVFDRVLVVHALEETGNAQPFLREIWRIMAPEGRLIVVAANRWSLWAQSERTAFGHGQPFSRRQLSVLLADAMFAPIASTRAIYAPPVNYLAGSVADALEVIGERVWRAFGGVVMIEAVKRLYVGAPHRRQSLLLAAAPLRPAPPSAPSTPAETDRNAAF